MPGSKSNPQLVLRPQDLVVLLRLAVEGGPAPSYAALAADLGMTASEAHAAVERAVAAQLAHKEPGGKATVVLDVMPTLESILGFSNRWYPLALKTAEVVMTPNGRGIRLVTAPVFLATKLEAFDGRGNGDYLFSHDLEDLLAVVDGRGTLWKECRDSAPELVVYLAHRFATLLATPAFMDALSGHLPGDAASQQRLPELVQKLHAIAGLR